MWTHAMSGSFAFEIWRAFHFIWKPQSLITKRGTCAQCVCCEHQRKIDFKDNMIPYILCFMIKISDFRGDITNVSAKTKSLLVQHSTMGPTKALWNGHLGKLPSKTSGKAPVLSRPVLLGLYVPLLRPYPRTIGRIHWRCSISNRWNAAGSRAWKCSRGMV